MGEKGGSGREEVGVRGERQKRTRKVREARESSEQGRSCEREVVDGVWKVDEREKWSGEERLEGERRGIEGVGEGRGRGGGGGGEGEEERERGRGRGDNKLSLVSPHHA